MKKMLFAVLTVFLLVLPLGVNAQRAPQYVFDRAGLLDELPDSERIDILTSILEVNNKHDISVAVLFVQSLEGEDEVSFTDDFYDENVYGDNGILLMYSVEDNIRYVSTSGDCIGAIDDNLSDISEAISGPFEDENYAEAIKAYVNTVDKLMSARKTRGWLISIVVAIVVGFVVAFIVTGSMRAQLNGAKFNNRAEDYVKKGSLDIKVSRDLFLYRTVNRVAKPKNNSSTHTSSSGRTHGGGRV